MTRYTVKQWRDLFNSRGKSMTVMKALEGVVAEYGDDALFLWQMKNGLVEKPRIRVKAISIRVLL